MMGIEVRPVSLPLFPLPEGFSSEAEYLRHLALKGLRSRFVGRATPSPEALIRLDTELRAICKGFPGYMLIVNDYVHWARGNRLSVNADRGAICGSLVAWALGITEDARSPLARGLSFESFANPMFAEHWLPDLTVGCFLAGRRVVTHFETDNWPGFLDAAVAFITENEIARYGYMRTPENKFTLNL